MDSSTGDAFELLASADGADRALGAFLLVGDPLDEPAIKQLRGLLGDSVPLVRETAAQALGSSRDTKSLVRIIQLMDSVSPREGWGFAWAVCEIAMATGGEARQEALEALRRYLRRARGGSRQHAQLLLGRLEDHYPPQGTTTG